MTHFTAFQEPYDHLVKFYLGLITLFLSNHVVCFD